MKKIIFGIFAHPDDEAFGPAGALLQETRSGTELHLITFTLGDAGTNPDSHDDLGAVRRSEWEAAGKLLGASSMHFLGYLDGQLDNQTMIEAGYKVVDHVKKILESAEPDIIVEFMSTDLNGVTGHVDHIVAARAACWAFYRLKEHDSRFSRIRLSCAPQRLIERQNTDWLYVESGRTEDEIDEVIDACEFNDDITAIMRTHHTQRGDGEYHIKQRGKYIGINHFIVME